MLELNVKYNGFYFQLGRKDAFAITEAKAKTRSLFQKICRRFELPANASTYDALRYNLRKGTVELKQLSNGRQYHEISGIGFGGYGHFLDEDLDIVVRL